MNIIRRILSLVSASRSGGRAGAGRPAGRRGRGRRAEPQATGIAALRRLISRR